tara:strand:+ start:21076 stop:21243 length:168 start_codon:yes stop_codon:yes gene_type:complete
MYVGEILASAVRAAASQIRTVQSLAVNERASAAQPTQAADVRVHRQWRQTEGDIL